MARVEGFRNQGIRACHTIQETYLQVLRKIDHAQEIRPFCSHGSHFLSYANLKKCKWAVALNVDAWGSAPIKAFSMLIYFINQPFRSCNCKL